jgi:hypothetical protein
MADYTVVNLKDVEDQAPKFGFAPDLEARFASAPLELQKSGFGAPKDGPRSNDAEQLPNWWA